MSIMRLLTFSLLFTAAPAVRAMEGSENKTLLLNITPKEAFKQLEDIKAHLEKLERNNRAASLTLELIELKSSREQAARLEIEKEEELGSKTLAHRMGALNLIAKDESSEAPDANARFIQNNSKDGDPYYLGFPVNHK